MMPAKDSMTPSRSRTFLMRLLLLIPFAAVLWPPLYNRAEPALIGVPFFYWYQMLWVIITACILLLVYCCERRNGQ
jgi:hypothetical protein